MESAIELATAIGLLNQEKQRRQLQAIFDADDHLGHCGSGNNGSLFLARSITIRNAMWRKFSGAKPHWHEFATPETIAAEEGQKAIAME